MSDIDGCTNLWKQEQDSKRKFHHVTWIDPKLSLERIKGYHTWSKIKNKVWGMIHHHSCNRDTGTAKHYRHQQRHLLDINLSKISKKKSSDIFDNIIMLRTCDGKNEFSLVAPFPPIWLAVIFFLCHFLWHVFWVPSESLLKVLTFFRGHKMIIKSCQIESKNIFNEFWTY